MAAGANVLGEAVVEITGDDAKLRASLDKAKQLTLGQELKANFMSGMNVKDMAIGMAAGYGAVQLLNQGIGALVEFTKSSTKAFMEEEKTLMGMQAVLSATDKNAGELTRDFAAWSEETERHTSLTHDQIEALILQAKMYGVATPQLKAMTQASIGLAKATGMDATGALHALTLAMSGEWMMLGRRSAAIRNAITDADKFAALQKLITTGMTAEAAQVNSTSGSFDQLAKSWDILKEQVGEGIAKKLEPFVWGMTQINRLSADNGVVEWGGKLIRAQDALITMGGSEAFAGIAKLLGYIKSKQDEISPMELQRLEFNKAITEEMKKQAGMTGKVGEEYKDAQRYILQTILPPGDQAGEGFMGPPAPPKTTVAEDMMNGPLGPKASLQGAEFSKQFEHFTNLPKDQQDAAWDKADNFGENIELLKDIANGITTLIGVTKLREHSVFSGK